MRILGWKRVVSLGLVTVFYGSTIPVFASTDDNSKSEPPAKRVAAKVDAPAPLTERERWLLDRVEELEKRVADRCLRGRLQRTQPHRLSQRPLRASLPEQQPRIQDPLPILAHPLGHKRRKRVNRARRSQGKRNRLRLPTSHG